MLGSFGVNVMSLTRLPLWSRQFYKCTPYLNKRTTHCIYQTLTCKTALELTFSQLNWSVAMFGACIATVSVRSWPHSRYGLCGFSSSLSMPFFVVVVNGRTVTKNFEIMHSSLVCCLFCGSFVNHILCLFHWKSLSWRNIQHSYSVLPVDHWTHVRIGRMLSKYSYSRHNATHFNLISSILSARRIQREKNI